MTTFVPSYYADFACLMGDCKHSCCIGWEIGIDDEMLEAYRRVPGNLGEKLKASIEITHEGAHFQLADKERCPFLTEEGLCELILALGPNSLCQICSDHPRFRNSFSHCTEMGLGLCCEAAARLILTQDTPFALVPLLQDGVIRKPDEEEQHLLSLRAQWIKTVQDRTLPFEKRLQQLTEYLPGMEHWDMTEWADFLITLERLDPAWSEKLALLKEKPDMPLCLNPETDLAFEQLCVYLLFRHIPGALQDHDLEGRLAYCIFICTLLRHIAGAQKAACGTFTPDDFIDLCRMYSAELEYSDENLCAMLDELDAHML